jgi:arylsulfatase A-like enzyme
MADGYNGDIKLDIRDSTPDWGPFREPKAPDGAPNVMYIVWDDTGFGSWDFCGGLVEMPNMRRLVDSGVLYSQFHTVAFCSPTRSCLLAGRNTTSNGMAVIEEVTTGFPGSSGRIPPENGTIAEVLVERGWATYAVGKWHLTPAEESSIGSSRRTWPLGKGFERYYGFLGGESDQYYPDLIADNHQVDQPYGPEDGYHLSKDLADKAISFIRDTKVNAPEKPWLMYFCPGANHAPHHSPKEWTDKYKGAFDMGYERYREIVLANQKQLGLIPQHTELPPLNPYEDLLGPDGQAFPEQDTVRPWASLSDDQKKLFSRMAEAFAGYSSYTDHQIGRLLDYLEESGQLENTIVVMVSDNGASAEGGPDGTVNENNFFNGIIDTVDQQMKFYDDIGTDKTYNHYPNGWAMAFSTPFKLFKRYSGHEGGTADPMVVSWPAGMKARGGVRHQYLHAVDIVPTIYDCLGIEAPRTLNGHSQSEIAGASFRSTFDETKAPNPRDTQLYVMLGTRGIWNDGWIANTSHPPMESGWSHFDQDTWELYHLDEDRNQLHDLAEQFPERLEQMKALWMSEAIKYNGLPLDDRTVPEILNYELHYPMPTQFPADRNSQVFYPGTSEVPERTALQYFGRSFSLLADVDLDAESVGVLFAHGGRFGGNSLFIKDHKLHYVYNWLGKVEQQVVSTSVVPTAGRHVLGVRFKVEGHEGPSPAGSVTLYFDDAAVGDLHIKIQPGHFSLAGEGINAGRDAGQPVSSEYEPPFEFRGGTLHRVVLERSDDPFVDLERHLAAGFARD